MIKTKAIDHVCLWVRSLPEAKRYYETIFGFVCTPRQGDSATLIVESEDVHFFISESRHDSDFLSKQHISFQVESLDKVITALNEMGIAERKSGDVGFFVHHNYKWCEWRDPSGIRLECVEIL